MDWLEEIALRDNCPVDMILADPQLHQVSTDPRLGRADKVKRLREMIRRRRFPRLAATEDSLQARIAELKLAPEILLSAPPGLEGGRLRVEFSASSEQELRRLAERLAAAAEKDAAREAFALLAGAAEEPRTRANQ
jgi:ParB family chromosome partitioning protein